jgi:integrative and conjugative element protein (TIGR02256 family)
LEKMFAHSGGVNTYVGDWHTHPRGVGELSPTDKSTLARIAGKRHDCTNTPTMVILADGQDSRWLVGAHRVVKQTWRPWGMKTTIERLNVKLFE